MSNYQSANSNYLTSQSLQTQSIIQGVSISGNNTSGTMAAISSGSLCVAGGNNITISQNANSITISGPNVGGAQTGISAIAGSAASSVTMGTIQFANGNGISFGLNSNTMTASHNAITTGMVSDAGSNWLYVNAGKNLTNISATLASNSISLSVGNYITTGMASNQNTSFVNASAAFQGYNVTGTIASNGISVSVAAPGAANESNNMSLLGNVVGNSTASGSTIAFYAGNNITLSGLNNSQIRIDGAAGAGGGVTYHLFEPFERNNTGTIQSQGTLFLSPVSINQYVTATRAVMIASIAESVNATLSEKATVSIGAIIYTLSNDNIRLQTVSSGSTSYSFNVGSGSSTNSVSFTGYRNFTLPININAAPGLYWLGMWSMTSISAAGATNNSIAFTMQGLAPRATAWYANDLSISNNSASTTCLQVPGHGYVTVSRSNTNLSAVLYLARSTSAGGTTNASVSFASRVPYIAFKDFDFPMMTA
jgi:hypothetical protein